PLYNHLTWGGYLIWRLPGRPVSMDGRVNLHTDERMVRAFHTEDGLRSWMGHPDEGWSTDPELAQARLVILPVGSALTSLLRRDRRFRLVYEDAVAVVFVANQSETPDGLSPKNEVAPRRRRVGGTPPPV